MDKMRSRTDTLLGNLALIKIAAKLWNTKYIPEYFLESWWFRAEKSVIHNAEKLKLPKALIDKIKILIRILGHELYRLMYTLYNVEGMNIEIATRIASSICWTSQAMININETLTIVSKDENLSKLIRFRLCCNYCTEKFIPELWNQLSEKEKSPFLNFKKEDLCAENFWSLTITHQQSRFVDPDFGNYEQYVDYFMAILSHKSENKYAFEYYFQRLEPDDKKFFLLRIFHLIGTCYRVEFPSYEFTKLYSGHHVYFNHLLIYLFSEADDEIKSLIQETGLKINHILISYLQWPHQDKLLTVTESLEINLTKVDYLRVIQAIFYKIKCNFKDYDYKSLLLEYWKRYARKYDEPIALIIAESFRNFFPYLDTEAASLILRCITPRLRKEMIFSKKGLKMLKDLGLFEDWDLLKLFVINCVPKEEFHDFEQMLKVNEENISDKLINSNICSFKNDTLKTFDFYYRNDMQGL